MIAFCRFAPLKETSSKVALVKSVPLRYAPIIFAPVRSTPRRLAVFKSAPLSFAPGPTAPELL